MAGIGAIGGGGSNDELLKKLMQKQLAQGSGQVQGDQKAQGTQQAQGANPFSGTLPPQKLDESIFKDNNKVKKTDEPTQGGLNQNMQALEEMMKKEFMKMNVA
ncbi:MAG: hypothetical protein WCK67_12255 [bacterium]